MLRRAASIGIRLAPAAIAAAAALWIATDGGRLSVRENVWSIAIYEGESPFSLEAVDPAGRPALTAADVSDVPALFVADPFMVDAGDRWLMFFEVLNKATGHGDIGLATSSDHGLNWGYEQIVLDEPFHLSYPSVFQIDGTWYMLPESQAAGAVRLYEAAEFPTRWRHVATLFQGEGLADPTLFRHGDHWWLFVGRAGTHDQLRLFLSEDLRSGWREHPASPVIEQNPETARPGGSVVQLRGGLYRFGQDCDPKYGIGLRAFRILKLTPTEYAESGPIPVLRASGSGWNTNGMHHKDLHALSGGRWRAAVDGHRKVWFAHVR